jgi:hypothetical protein
MRIRSGHLRGTASAHDAGRDGHDYVLELLLHQGVSDPAYKWRSIRRKGHHRRHWIVRLLHDAGHADECGQDAGAAGRSTAAGYVSALKLSRTGFSLFDLNSRDFRNEFTHERPQAEACAT